MDSPEIDQNIPYDPSNASPRPWIMATDKAGCVTIEETDGYEIASHLDYVNAGHIIKCVNNYDEMLECLKESYRYLDPTSKYADNTLRYRVAKAIQAAQ